MTYTKTEWKDRIVEHPNRYKDQNNNQYTLTPDFGVVTEAGVPVTAVAMNNLEEGVRLGQLSTGTELSTETSELFNETNVDEALKRSLNLSSYMAFCGNVNSDSLDGAFGKNNEDIISNLGFQLSMYAWFKGVNKTTYPFINLKSKSLITDILGDTNALNECSSTPEINDIIDSSQYATNLFKNKFPLPLNDYGTVIASTINLRRYDLDTDATASYVVGSLTVPYSGKYTLLVTIGSNDDIVTINITKNGSAYTTMSMTRMFSEYYQGSSKEVSLLGGDVLELTISTTSSKNKVVGGVSMCLLADRPITLPTTVSAGNEIIWIADEVNSTATSYPATTQVFTCTKNGTYRVFIAGAGTFLNDFTQLAVQKNGVSITTGTFNRYGMTYDIPLVVGDTVRGYVAGYGTSNPNDCGCILFAVGISTNANTYPVI